MSGFEDFGRQAAQLEREIVRWGLVLGIDWNDDAQVAALAREAVAIQATMHGLPADPRERARVELFGLAQLMLTVTAESAGEGIHTHGGPAWKALGRALFEASNLGDRK
ncbi:MAG: hypothetical protein Q8O25_01405 [Sulfurisoma sp.]|nr:hypothetical protein [Sulfurisoma sp.]